MYNPINLISQIYKLDFSIYVALIPKIRFQIRTEIDVSVTWRSFKYISKSTRNRLFFFFFLIFSAFNSLHICNLWEKIYIAGFDIMYEFYVHRLTATEAPGGFGESKVALNLIIEDRIIFLKEFSQQFSYIAKVCHFSSQTLLAVSALRGR